MNTFQSLLTGKAGILTGRTSGFGYEIVQALVRQGAHLAVFSVDELSEAAVGAITKQRTGQRQISSLGHSGPGRCREHGRPDRRAIWPAGFRRNERRLRHPFRRVAVEDSPRKAGREHVHPIRGVSHRLGDASPRGRPGDSAIRT